MQKIEVIEAVSALLDANDVQFEDEPAIEEGLFVWKDRSVGFAREGRSPEENGCPLKTDCTH